MDVKPYPQDWVQPLVERLESLHRQWVPILGLDGWRDESYIDLNAADDGSLTHGVVEAADWEYERFRIRYSPNLLNFGDDDFVEWVVVHELSHVVAAPIRDLLLDLLDEVADDEDGAEVVLERLALRMDDQWTSRTATALIKAESYGRLLAAKRHRALEVVGGDSPLQT